MTKAALDESLVVEALRRVSRHLSKSLSISYAAQRNQISKFGVSLSDDAINDFARVGGTKRFHDPEVLPAIRSAFEEKYPDIFARFLREVRLESLIKSNAVVNELHDFWLPDEGLNQKDLHKLQGFYAVYRPFFMDPTGSVMLASLECGVDDQITQFRMQQRYRDGAGVDRDDLVEGHIILLGDTAIFVGRLVGREAPFIFALSGFPVTHGKVERSEGMSIVGARGERVSSHPIIIIRREQLPEPRVYSLPEARENVPEWLEVSRVCKF